MIMRKKKVLYVLHNHPSVRPGGAEAYALELYNALRRSDEFEPLLVARIAPNPGPQPSDHPGTPFATGPQDAGQYFVLTEDAGIDFFLLTARDKSLYTVHFEDFLRTHRPDVVHFQHTHFIGCDLVTLAKHTLPHAPLLYTLHEYLPICNRDGQMLRTNDELCLEESPRRCNECFPEWSRQRFFMRKKLIQAHFSNIDLFLAPSRFLLERYVDWGIPRDRIRFEDYGRLPAPSVPAPGDRTQRNRFGFFGQVNPYKGLEVVLEAMKVVRQHHPEAHLWIHGANLEMQTEEMRSRFVEMLQAVSENVTFAGAYDHSSLPGLMADIDWVVVPSRWWENSPLVIQEAFLHRRPVICSDIGGMAEKVTDGINGLHFRVADPFHLAHTIDRAIETPGLWETLRDGIGDVFSMQEHVANLSGIYTDLIARKRAPDTPAPLVADPA
jgi:glycosyltransferase involved in cell wall biosynthesis